MDAIFVVGTGRSGTHFTCRALRGFSNIDDPMQGNENGPLLKSIALSALYHRGYPRQAERYYADRKASAAGRVFLDQHHPNIFFTQALGRIFDRPVFIYPQRPIEQVVASMMNHKGVLGWYARARRGLRTFGFTPAVPIPNQFLGVRTASDLTQLPLHQLCALRVLAHRDKMRQLCEAGPMFRTLPYELLVQDQAGAFASVFSKAELDCLGEFSVTERGDVSSLAKYKDTLNPQQIREIREIEGNFHG